MNQNANVLTAVLKAIVPTRRGMIIGGIAWATVFGLAIYGAFHLIGAV